MANLNENLTKYLDYNGLGQFLVKLKEYIADRISEVNGSNLNLYNSGETNPTIASEIERIWTVLGEGGDVSISGQIQSILGQYVKDIQQGTGDHADLDDLIKVSVVEGTEDSKDIYTISLEGTGLVEKLQDLTSERVSSIDATGTDGGAVTLSIDKSKGDVKLTVNSKALTERVETLESRSGKYNSGNSLFNGYLLGGASVGGGWDSISSTNLKYSIGSHGAELGWRGVLTIGTDFYGGISLGTMPNSTDRYINIAPEHRTGGITIGSGSMTIGSDIIIGSNDIIIGSGEIFIGSNVNLGTMRIGKNKDIILRGQQINLDCIYGVKIKEVILGTSEDSISPVFPNFTCIKGNLIGTAQDSLSLGGQLPSYYATKEDVQSIQSSYVKDITTSNSNTGTKYVTISPDTAAKDNVTITIDDTAAKEKFESIDNYTINGKKISGSPTLTGDDITLGKSVGDNTNYPTTMDIPEAIQKLRETMTGLGKVVNLSGVYEKWEDYTSTPINGDFVIVGQKEYVYWDGWIELGDTTQVTQYLNDLINKYNSHTHSFTPTGTVTSTFTGAQNTTSSSSLNISYTAGRLIIKSSHTHTVTPTGTVTSIFNGGSGTSGSTGSTQSLPPMEPSAPDSFNPGGGGSIVDYSKEYLTIEALDDGEIILTDCQYAMAPGNTAFQLHYSLNNGEWVNVLDPRTISVNAGDKVRLKGDNAGLPNMAVMDPSAPQAFSANMKFNVYGNIKSMIYGDDFITQQEERIEFGMFLGAFAMSQVVSAKNLIFPSIVEDGCYMMMFAYCDKLEDMPELPAVTLKAQCYLGMFAMTNISKASVLPAITLARGCYQAMFTYCANLIEAPVLPATTLVSDCYTGMFAYCPQLNKIVMLANDFSQVYYSPSSVSLTEWTTDVSEVGTFIKHPDVDIDECDIEIGPNGIPEGWIIEDADMNGIGEHSDVATFNIQKNINEQPMPMSQNHPFFNNIKELYDKNKIEISKNELFKDIIF